MTSIDSFLIIKHVHSYIGFNLFGVWFGYIIPMAYEISVSDDYDTLCHVSFCARSTSLFGGHSFTYCHESNKSILFVSHAHASHQEESSSFITEDTL